MSADGQAALPIIDAIAFDAPRLRRLAAALTAELGIQLPESKLTMLHGRLQRRVRELGLRSIAEYARRLEDPAHRASEQVELFDLATTNKTEFFREPEHFRYLVDQALPALAKARPRTWCCRIWCAACSTGQEAYTLAMVLAEYQQQHPEMTFEITATDISTRVLRAAAAATYPAELAAPIPAPLRHRYLLRGKGERAGQVRVVPELRAHVRFARLNFMDAAYTFPTRFDVIFCRNVLIYFERAVQEQVIQRECEVLSPGGFLFVGHSESLSGMRVPLRHVATSVARRT